MGYWDARGKTIVGCGKRRLKNSIVQEKRGKNIVGRGTRLPPMFYMFLCIININSRQDQDIYY